MNITIAGFKTALTVTALGAMTCVTTPVWADDELWGDADTSSSGSVYDPLESVNRTVHDFNKVFDDFVLAPVARGYDQVAPQPVKRGASNFFDNLSYPVVVVNDLLQGKFIQGGSDFARFLVNSTIGLFGIFDVATHLDMVEHDEDLGQTLAAWGVGDGAYLVLPFYGPSNLRDGVGLIGDAFIDPLYDIEGNGDRNALVAAKAVDTRHGLLKEGDLFDESAIDPYAFMRSAYRQNRAQEISQ
ncbi:MAG: VacJ family lipoprotein [Gammaproteobacteria bacterium]